MSNMSLRVLNTTDVSDFPEVFDELKNVARVDDVPCGTERLVSLIGGYDAYFGGLQPAIGAEVIQNGPRLRAVVTATTGLDHIDTVALASAGIELLSLKDESEFLDGITATAEMTWALLLSLIRKVPWSFASVQSGGWKREEFQGRQLSGLTLGILGYGRLGRMVAEYGKSFRMRVLACDRSNVSVAPGVNMVDFQTLVRSADVLSLHVHLSEENRGLIGDAELRAMKPGAILLNSSRGGIVDEAALLRAVESGHLGGAGLDVLHGEWASDPRDHPLVRYSRSHRNVVITPHTGGMALDARRMTTQFMARKLAEFLKSQPARPLEKYS